MAALCAASESGTVALGNRRLAKMYGLDVLAYPVQYARTCGLPAATRAAPRTDRNGAYASIRMSARARSSLT